MEPVLRGMKRKKALMNILLVEDNPGDVRLTQEALREQGIFHHLSIVSNGEDALNFLEKKAAYEGVEVPDIILLDLNIPRKNGKEVLREIKNNDAWKMIPVVVLTTSDAEQDILASYQLHANCFISKPVDIDQFIEVIKSIEDFWFNIVKLPSRFK